MAITAAMLTPIQQNSIHCDAYKIAHVMSAIVLIALPIIVGSIILAGVAGIEPFAHALTAGTFCYVVAIGGIVLSYFMFHQAKKRYHEMCPEGNWRDFLKRPWDDFSTENYMVWKVETRLLQKGLIRNT